MFKKFKEKIAEEVKSSPQRLQQFTQSVADKIQQNSSSEENSYFSITEDDNLQNNLPHSEPGFSNVPLTNYTSTPRNESRIRRSSTSSMASDISFLPRYESNTNIYHLQSDLDVSASEMEDNTSSSSSQLGHLTKEQLYAAFRKSQVRYHKYRGRFTDLANHYKTLERENSKMKSVLGETQDNALRRVAELKEQCSLEQKAKAHLENALRVEIDEKQYTIETLRTKVGLLQNGPLPTDETASNNLDLLANDLRDARTEIESLNAKLQETKANSIVLSSREGDLKKKVAELEAVIRGKDEELGKVVERERETNLQVAQTKMELHCEIQNRDLELANLKRDMETMRVDLEQYEIGKKSANQSKLDNLQAQNLKLVEKVEALNEKLIAYESDKLQLEKLKIETEDYRKRLAGSNELTQQIDSLLQQTSDLKSQLNQQETEYSAKITQMKDEAIHNLLSLETKIRDQISGEFAQRELELKEKLSNTEGGAEDIQLKLIESEAKVDKLRESISELEKEKDRFKKMESNYLLLMEEKESIKKEARSLEDELSAVKHKIEELQGEVLEVETARRSDQQKIHSLMQTLEQQNVNAENKQEQVDYLKSDVSNLTHRLQEIESQKQESEQHVQSLKQKLTQSCEENSGLSRLTENYKTQLEEYEKELLRAKQERDDLSNLSNANEIFSVRLEETERKLLESEAENETLTQNYNTIVAQLEEAKKELTEVRQKGDEISDVNVTLTDRFEKNEIKLLENESKLQENERLMRNYEAQLEEERNELTQVKQEIETVLEANRKLSTQLEQVELTHQKETDFLKAAIEKFERDKSDCETITLQLEETEKKLQTLESDHREEINKLKADYESLCQISSGREADLDKHKRCVEEANQQIENFREKNEKLAAEINGYDIQVEDLKKAAQELSAENRQLKQALEVQQTETEQRIEDLKKAQLEKGSDDFELQVLVDENKRLCENELLGKKHVKEFELRCTSLEKNNADLTESVKGLTEQLALLQTALETLKEESHEKEAVRIRLEAEKQAMVEQLDRLQENESETKKLSSDVEVEELRHKLAQYKSLDQSNRSSIQFYEGELQKLKNRNEKLGQRLDETLVALNHCPDLTSSTENEYLRNVLYNYMLGKESIVLARVIAAVCKFDASQTEAVLQREQQKQTVLGQLGFL